MVGKTEWEILFQILFVGAVALCTNMLMKFTLLSVAY